MSDSTVSSQDPERRAALRRYDILGTEPERAFDRVAELAARLLDAPMAGVHFIDDQCQWAKAQVGLEAETLGLDVSFCAHELGAEEMLVVPDATEDPRFEANPLVTGDPGIRFYAGAALVTPDGYALGRLCVLDTEPRPEGLDPDEHATLRDLAGVVMDELEYRAQPRHREKILESITDAFFAIDDGWQFTYLNERAGALLQRPREELLGNNVWDEFPEAKELAFYDEYHRAMQTGEAAEFEAYFPPLRTWFEVKAYPMETGGLSVYFNDVTERKDREGRLRLLSRAVEDASEAVLVTGPKIDGPGPRIEYVNPAFEDMTGYAADEVIGKTPRILQGPATDRATLDVVRSHLEAGTPLENTTAVNYRKDGTPFWVEWNISPVRGEDGQVQHWVSVQRDVTERRRLQAALREREEYLSVTLGSIGDAVIATGPEGCITEMNKVAEELTGWAHPEAEGRPLDELIRIHNAKTGEPVESPVAKVLSKGRIVGMANHTVLTARDGTERQIADSAAPIRRPGGELLGVVLVFRDVTEAYAQREALETQRERLEMALVGGNLGMWDWDMQTNEVIYDERWARMLGYSPDEVQDTEVFFVEHIHPSDLKRVRSVTERHAQDEIPYIDLEIRMRHRDGSWRWILDRGKIVERDDDGTPLRMVGTHMDVTERKEAEQALAEREALLRSINDHIAEGIYRSTPDEQLIYVNEAFATLFGYDDRERLLTLDDPAALYARPERRDELVRKVHEQGVFQGEKVEFQRADGSTFWGLLSARTVYDDDGTVKYRDGAVMDITEQHEMEMKLRRSEALFRSFVEQAVDVVALFDAEGTFKYLSPSIERITGYTRDQLVGTDGFAPVHPDDLAAVRAAFLHAVEHPGQTAEVEGRYHHRDGSWRHLSIRGRRLPTPGSGVEVLANVHDITERKQRERELLFAKERAEEMSRLKSAFLANMSHEIRTPLTSIIGFADVLRGQVDGEAEELLKMIRQSGKRLEETLTSVLDLAKIEGEAVRVQLEPVDFAAEVRMAVDLFRPRAEAKDIDLSVDVPQESDPGTVDPRLLRRVLSNLIANAIKFTEEGQVTVRLRVSTDTAIIEVEDTGVGIAPEQVERIFEEFVQESEGYTRSYEGTGLGLSITRRLVNLLGGQIDVESEKGVGSLFRVTLPREHAASTSEPPDEPQGSSGGLPTPPDRTAEADGGPPTPDRPPAPSTASSARGDEHPPEEARPTAQGNEIRVLLVEDNKLTRQVLPMLLRQIDERYVVDTTVNAEEALARADTTHYDLFLIDINFGTGPTGLDVMRRLRDQPRYQNTPMVACTAYAMPADRQTFLEAGFDAYLAKPFRAQKLLDTLQHVRGSKGASSDGE